MKVDTDFFARLLFAAILVMCAAVAVTVVMPESPDSRGTQHPDFATMRHGAEDGTRDGPALLAGWLLGTATILVFVALIAFGGQQRGRLRGLGGPLVAGTVLCLALWTWVVVAYAGPAGEAPRLYLALPASSAVVLFLLWPLTTVFIWYFVLGFRRWVLTDEDLARYERLLAAKRLRDEDGGGGGG